MSSSSDTGYDDVLFLDINVHEDVPHIRKMEDHFNVRMTHPWDASESPHGRTINCVLHCAWF